MSLGIVIVSYKCRELALECLASIERELPAALTSTVVIDNASGDGTLDAIACRFPRVARIARAKNVGFAAAANAGIRALPDCDVICLLNPDTLLLDGGLASAARFLADHPNVGVLGARIENPDGGIQASCRAFPSHLTALFNRHSLTTKLAPGNRWSRHYLMSDWSHDEPRDVDWVSGACMLIHRRTLQTVGLLDPEYFFSIEDVDYARRVHDAGLRVMYYPQASIQHRVGGSSRHAVYRAMTEHHRGMWRYYRQHMATNRLLDAVTAAGIAGRLGIHAASYGLRTAKNRALRRANP